MHNQQISNPVPIAHSQKRQFSGAVASIATEVGFSRDAFSSETTLINQRIRELRNVPSPGVSVFESAKSKPSIEERLFEATAAVKVLTSQVAMHLDKEWRNKLFFQLDSLHDPDEWEGEDSPIRKESFDTFLKAICHIKPARRPGLGLAPSGNLIAAWTNPDDRLTIEFLPLSVVRWVLSQPGPDGFPERFTGQTKVERLQQNLRNFNFGRWFDTCPR